MPKLIGLVGKARAGKSTVAEHYRSKFGYTIISLADPLKTLVLHALKANPPPYEIPCPQDHVGMQDAIYVNRTPFTRWLLQFIGTDVVRNGIDENFWIVQAEIEIEHARALGHDIVISDVRFPDEAVMIRHLGGKLLKIERPDHWQSGSVGEHISETGIDRIVPDYAISCNTGAAMLRMLAEPYARAP